MEATGASKTREGDIMKYFKNINDITKLAADDILAYMLDGYTLCMTELKGAYGFAGRQEVLERGNERVVIWMERERGEFDRWEDDYVLRIAHFVLGDEETMEFQYCWNTQWAEHVVKEWRAYNLNGKYHGAIWTTDREEAKMSAEKRMERRERKHVSSVRALDVTPKLMKVVRRIKGFKTAKAEDIRVTFSVDRRYMETEVKVYQITKLSTKAYVTIERDGKYFG